jgi:hypothetical protein
LKKNCDLNRLGITGDAAFSQKKYSASLQKSSLTGWGKDILCGPERWDGAFLKWKMMKTGGHSLRFVLFVNLLRRAIAAARAASR